MSKMKKAAEAAIREVLDVQPGEEVLIISNFDCDAFTIARFIYEAALEAKARATFMVQPRKTQYDDAERIVLEAIKSEPDVIVAITDRKVGKDPFGLKLGYVGRDGKQYNHIYDAVLWGNRRCRSFWSPGVTVDMFERCVPVDYSTMRALASKLKDVLDDGKEMHVTSPAGTNICFSIEGRKGQVDDGDFRWPGKGGNLPCGEAYVSPRNGTVEGVIVFDGTLDLVPNPIIPKEPVKVFLKGGFITQIEGGKEAEMLLKVIERGETLAREMGKKEEERNARAIGELGIGINPKAKMTCNMLEDEKVWSTVHFAIGSNLDNDAHALIHQDCLVLNPSLFVDGRQIMKDGEILI
ncbi:MAG: aminopeptidase [Methanomassiliicoccales archaeon]